MKESARLKGVRPASKFAMGTRDDPDPDTAKREEHEAQMNEAATQRSDDSRSLQVFRAAP